MNNIYTAQLISEKVKAVVSTSQGLKFKRFLAFTVMVSLTTATAFAQCNNVTAGGTITGGESNPSAYNPGIITSATLPSGGSGTIEYLWLYTTDESQAFPGGSSWISIPNSNSASYDPPSTITTTTYYLRCSRRSGCSNYDGESNVIVKSIASTECSCPNNLILNPSFEIGTTYWDWSGGNFNSGTYAAVCGTKSGQFQITNNSNNWFSNTFIDDGSISAGTVLNLSVYAGTHAPSYYHQVGIAYFDFEWNWISGNSTEVNSLLPTMTLYNISSVVPAGAHYIQVTGSGNGDWLKTDLWCVTVGGQCNPDNTNAPPFCAPTPSCPSGSLTWSQTINGSTGDPSIVRFYSGGTTAYTLPVTLPSAFNGPVSVNITQAIAYDGYVGRSSTGDQPNEKFRVIFLKNGSVQWSSNWTGSNSSGSDGIATGVNQDYWSGALGSANLPNGADQIRLIHWSNSTYGTNDNTSPNSVVPSSVCISYSPICNLSVTIDESQTICTGGSAKLTASPSGGSGNYSYSWSNSLGSNYYVDVTPATTTTYSVTVTDNSTGCTATGSATVTVVSDPTITAQPTNISECVGGTLDFTVTATGGTPALTYQWQTSTNAGGPWSSISGATQSYYKPSSTTPGTKYYRVIVSASGLGCGNATSSVVSAVIYSDPSISAHPQPQTICTGANATVSVTASGGVPPLTYQWQSSPNNSTWTNISGATNSSYTSGSLTSNTYFRVLVSSSGSGCGTATSNSALVTVNPYPQASFTSTQAGCTSNSGSITFTFPDNPNFTQIQFSLNGGSTYQPAVSDNIGSVTYSNLAAGTYNLFARWGTGVCPVDLGDVTITNTAGPLVNIACEDDPVLSRVASNSSQTCGSNVYGFWSGNLVSNWTSQQHWSVSGGSFLEYANGTAVLTMTATNNANSNLVFNITAVFSGRTYSPPAGSPKESTQCVGDLNNSDWYYYTAVDGNLIGAGALAGGVVEFTRFGEAFQMGTGANLNNAAAFGASGWLTFDIKKNPSSGTNFNSNPGHGDFNMNMSGGALANMPPDCLNICVGESTTLTANAASGTPPYTYLWSNGATASSITVSPSTTTTYSVTATDSNGCTHTDQATITVYQGATVNAGPDQTICVGATVTMAGTIGGSATSATWTSSVAGGSFNPNATTLNAVYTPPSGYTGVITMTLTTNDPAGSCLPAVDQMIITIIADPSVSVQPVGATICAGGTHTMTVSATGGTPSLTYQWQS
ncbi:MAG: hypothetical protein HUU34_22300, partial [Saprospiraceae bacterium]|nr:hypothetical protein [Saprospiraceae bacterium]